MGRAAIVNTVLQLRKKLKADVWPKPFQIVGIAYCAIAGDRALIADEMGLGKLLPLDVNLLTPSGWCRMGNIQVGDAVTGSKGGPVTVTAVHPQGVKASYRVTFSDDSSVETGAEHLWTMYYWCGGKWLRELTLTTEQLRTRPVIQQYHPSSRPTSLDLSKTVLYLPMMSSPALFHQLEPVPLGGYTLGQLIANGGLTNGGARLTSAVWDWPHVEQQIRMDGEGHHIGSVNTYDNVVQTGMIGLMPILRRLGLTVLSGKKRIPRCYLEADVETRIDLLHGLMDSDGTVSETRNKAAYCTTSAGLAYDVRELVECLGGIAQVHSYDRSKDAKPTDYLIQIRLPLSIKPFTLPRKADRYNPGSHAHPTRTVVSVEYVRDVESQCISVSAPDGLYVTERAIVTHNSAEALCRVLLGNHFPAVVVCPSGVLLNWQDEILGKEVGTSKRREGGWLPRCPVRVISTQDAWVPPLGWKGIVIVTWDLLRHHAVGLKRMQPKMLIADEAHYIHNEEAFRSEALQLLADTTPYLLLLTGSPIKNHAKELWRLLNLIAPKAWPDDGPFKEVNKEDFDRGVQSRLATRTKQYMLRRLKSAAMTDLKAKQYQTLKVQLPPNAMAEYKRIEKQFAVWLDRKVRKEVLAERPELEGLQEEFLEVVAERTQRSMNAASLVQVGFLRRLLGVLKAPLAVEWAAAAAAIGEPVVIFAEHKEAIKAMALKLEERRLKYAVFDGSTNKTKRHKLVKAFQNGGLDILVISQAGKEGLTLTRARHVLFAERFWTGAAEDQAADRLHRISQRRDVNVWVMCAIGTYDERQDAIVTKKRAITKRTVGADSIQHAKQR